MKVYVVVDACYDIFRGVFKKKEYAEEYIEEFKSEGNIGECKIFVEEI